MSFSKRKNVVNNSSSSVKRAKLGDDTQDDGTEESTFMEQQNTSRLIDESNVGIIQSLTLTNFMCHSKLYFEFGRNINYVIGRNGSGKSAVLTGLVVGLGGKANATSRGKNLKGFIKSGKQFCTIKVCLRNEGSDAFKPDCYGKVISVERRIPLSGAGSYKIMGINGQLISDKKEELLAILDQFNIQVDNPVCILNQNTSRNFLNTKSPKDRYAFFMKATQLEQMKKSNLEAEGKFLISRDMLERKKETLPEVKRELEIWEKKYKSIQSIEEQEKKLLNLKIEYAWAYVSELDEAAENLGKEFNAQSNKTDKFHSSIQKTKDMIKVKNVKCENLNQQLKAVTVEIKKLTPEDTQSKNDVTEINSLIRSKEAEKANLNREIQSSSHEESSLKRQISEILKTDPQHQNETAQQRRTQINALEHQKSEYEAQKKTTDCMFNNLRDSVTHHQEICNNLRQEEKSLESQIQNTERRLKDLGSSQKNQLIRYGRDIPNLVEQIERAFAKGEFRKKPIGPIGAHIVLRDPKWAVGVEKCLGRLLQSFCVDNHDDEKVLKSIMKITVQDGNKPSIIVSKFQPKMYDVSRYATSCNPHSNLLNMLIINDSSVANCLIDQRNIESVLLIADKSEARNVMTHKVPRNCRETFTIEGDQVYPAPSFRYYTNASKTSRFLQGSVEDKMKEANQYLNKLKSDLVAKKQETLESNRIFQSNRQQLKEIELRDAEITQSITKLRREINMLINFAEPEPIDVSSLEEDVKSLQQKHSQLIQQQNNVQDTLIKLKNKKEGLKKKCQEIDVALQKLFGDTQPLKEELTVNNNDLDNLKTQKLHTEKELKDHEKNVTQIKEKWETAKLYAQSQKDKTAETCGAYKRSRKSSSEIMLKIKEIEQAVDFGKKNQSDPLEVSQRYLNIKKKYDHIKNDISSCEIIIRNIETGIKQRQQSFIKYRESLALRVKLMFELCLRTRNFAGKTIFDHKSGSLLLEIQTSESVQQNCTDMRSLSGGERSFSTVCFVLTLWEIMESPFRILDEYDVFMDMVTRRISMEMMMDVMVKKYMNQFILLTPLDMSNIQSSNKDLVKICCMPDPERSSARV